MRRNIRLREIFCKIDCSQAYHHCLQVADQRPIELLPFNFAGRTFAYKRLAQGLSRAISAFSSFMRDKVKNANQCAQYVDYIGIVPNDADELTRILRETFECIPRAGLKVTMHKFNFGAIENKILGRTITPLGVKTQKNVHKFLEKTKFSKFKKALQMYLRMPKYYRNYIPRLTEKLIPSSIY